ncbi:hypothetical protein Nepgr_007658 [Nepenthes gracilis]|uniref:Transcription factor CBF/NF-Y/archaeal histone domain-containing protein n=1 Tax=Nepenthes gracilis TaxID=150966 RepID=A0AAD3XIH9_NEPGR|nr:hypothetical protein Nepgr_007658 [Nepenthes gracilis]
MERGTSGRRPRRQQSPQITRSSLMAASGSTPLAANIGYYTVNEQTMRQLQLNAESHNMIGIPNPNAFSATPATNAAAVGIPQPPQAHGLREHDNYMPIANVIRIMRRILPPYAKIADDAKDTVQECVSEYISFVTGEANDRCKQEQRKTITAEDVIWAMAKLGFDDYVAPLSVYLQRHREIEGGQAAMRKELVPVQKRSLHYGVFPNSGNLSSRGGSGSITVGPTNMVPYQDTGLMLGSGTRRHDVPGPSSNSSMGFNIGPIGDYAGPNLDFAAIGGGGGGGSSNVTGRRGDNGFGGGGGGDGGTFGLPSAEDALLALYKPYCPFRRL